MKHHLLWFLTTTLPFLSFAQADSLQQADAGKSVDTASIEVSTFLVFFPTASHQIETSYHQDLDRIAAQLIEAEDTIRLLGYTDNVGDALSNQRLSERRAGAVKDYLVAASVPEGLIKTAYFGEDQPKADNSTAAGRSQNRRVEIMVLSGAALLTQHSPEGDTTLYEEEKADSFQEVLGMPPGAVKVEKPLPVINRPTTVELKAVERHLISSNGATLMLGYNYRSGDAPPKGIFLQVKGANSFYDIPTKQTAKSGRLNVPVSFPTQLGKGEVAVVACLLNQKGQLSKPDTIFVEMQRLGTGKIQISLSWDTETDQDLYVTTPTGEVINYVNKKCDSGGELDRDDQDGFGPENVFWLIDAPDGEYKVEVNDYTETLGENAFVVTFNGLGVNRQFYGTTRDGSTAQVATFVKQGNRITWKESQ